MSKVKIEGNASGTGTLTIAAPNTNTDRTLTLPDADITLGGGVDGVDSDYTSGTAVKIDSSGRVGIGTSSPSEELHIYKNTTDSVDLKIENSEGSATLKANNDSFYIDADNHVFRSEASSEYMRIDSSGNLKFNSGYGSAATAYGCRAWVNFNGTGTVAIRASGNVSSLSDLGTGKYSISFSTSMPDTNYAVVGTASKNASEAAVRAVGTIGDTGYGTSSVRLETGYSTSPKDVDIVGVGIFR
jgi:hypothetical protein